MPEKYIHQEPHFVTTPGKNIGRGVKKPTSETAQSMDSEPTVKEEVSTPELIKEDFEKIWAQVEGDEKLRELLAHVVRGNYQDQKWVTVEDVKIFYNLYPTEENYLKRSPMVILFMHLKDTIPTEEYHEYQSKAAKFLDVMFPEK